MNIIVRGHLGDPSVDRETERYHNVQQEHSRIVAVAKYIDTLWENP